jgi:hypothetical protein
VGVTGKLGNLCTWQLGACLLGVLAGFVPGVSFTGPSTGMYGQSGGLFIPADDRRVRVTEVQPGSPADRAGFRVGDIIQKPGDFDGVRAALAAVQRGEKQIFTIKRGETELALEPTRSDPDIAAIWFAHEWYPIAGALFLSIGIFVFATGRLVPAPLWRSILVTVAGVGIAAGFGLDLLCGTPFSRFRIYQVWPMGTGGEWYFQQGLIGMVAGVLLAMFAAAEIRQRLGSPPASTEPVKRVASAEQSAPPDRGGV